MINRRKFLAALGAAALMVGVLAAQSTVRADDSLHTYVVTVSGMT